MDKRLEKFAGSRVMITGGGGYIGSKVAEQLASRGIQVFAVDRAFNTFSQSLAGKYQNVLLQSCDLTDESAVAEICSQIKPDYIFHMAALLNRDRDFSVFPKLFDVNVKGTLNVLSGLKHIPYKGFFFASTGEVYGYKHPVPFSEEVIPEPVSPYSLTKVMAENLIKTFSDINQKPYTIFRIFNFFGPDIPESTIVGQLLQCLRNGTVFKMTKGEQARDYLYIDDLVNALVSVSAAQLPQTDIFNICSGKGTRIKDLVEAFTKASGNKLVVDDSLPYRENEVWEMIGSVAKLNTIVPQVQNTSFEDGFKVIIYG